LGKKYPVLKFFVADSDPGSGAFLTLEPGLKNSVLEKNIPNPQHCPSLELLDKTGTVPVRILILPV
jgi:hypothetical protein